jgi:DNA-binding beta-propeller fold protein YncE
MLGQTHRQFFALGFTALIWTAGVTAADEPSLALKQTILLKGKAGSLDHLALDTKHDRLLLANKVNNTLDIVDLKEGKLLRQIRNQGGIQGIAYASDLDMVFVGLGTGGFCNVFDGKDYKLQKTIKFADDADNVRYNAANKRVYVAHAEKALGVIDAKTYELKTDIKLPGSAEGFQIESKRPRMYLNIPTPAEVTVIDVDKNEILHHFPVKMAASQFPLAIDEANHRLYLGCRKEPMVVIMDSETGKEISSVAIPGDVDDLFFDAKRKRLYASCGEGFIAVLKQNDADHCELLEKIETVKGAKTSYFDAATDRLFLAVPRQEGKEGPEIRVYHVRP